MFEKPAPKSLRRKSGREPGGQPGHPGSTLSLVYDPQERIRHEPVACGGCGGDLIGTSEVGVERRRVFDLPEIKIGVNDTAARTSVKMRSHNALAHRLIARQADYLRFTTDHAVPPDNNGSERDIRMIKLRQKVSGCMRTITGAEQFCAIRSYISTAAKHGRRTFETLVTLAEGRARLPA